MQVLNVKTIIASTDEELEFKLRELEKNYNKLEHIIFTGQTTENEKLWTVIYKERD